MKHLLGLAIGLLLGAGLGYWTISRKANSNENSVFLTFTTFGGAFGYGCLEAITEQNRKR